MSRFKTIRFSDSDRIYVVDTVDDMDMGSFVSQRCAEEFTEMCEHTDDVERLKQFRKDEKEKYKKAKEFGFKRFSYEWNMDDDEGWLKDSLYEHVSIGPYKDEWELQQRVLNNKLMSPGEIVLYDKKMMKEILPKYGMKENFN